MSDNFLAGQSAIWVQPDGPNTKPEYLGCHSIADVTEPKGDKTTLYCPDRAHTGKFTVKNSYRGEPGQVTFTIETDLRKTADYLEQLGACGVPIYVNKIAAGRRDTFLNFDRSFAFYPADITQLSLNNLAARQPSDENETLQAFDMSSDELFRLFKLQAYRISVTEPSDITGIAICGEERCEGPSGAGQAPEDYIYLGTNALAASASATANVLASVNGGAFAATAADPFAATEDIQGIVCFRVGRDTIRILVARGTTDAGNPAEIAYSDDGGATWTAVDVGSTNGEYCASTHALFAWDRYHIWLGTDGGRIYFSNDGGITWNLQENAVISATDVVAISFVDTDVGFALYTGGEVASVADGSSVSAAWSAVTSVGVAGQADLVAITPYFLYAVGSNGKYYSHDGGVTWAQRDAVATAAIDFYGDLLSLAVGSAVSGPLNQTIDGGYDWDTLPAVTNQGFLDVKILNPRLAYVVGNTVGGTGFVAKLIPQP